MSKPSIETSTQICGRISSLLAQRRNYRQEIKDLIKQYPHVVFYGCGVILGSIVDTWNEYIGRKIDYCCDSDEAKWGKYFCGAKCLSPKELTDIKDKCVVFVTIGDFKAVYNYLTVRGFPSVNLIYNSDLVATDYLASHEHSKIVSNLCKTYGFLSDRQSVKVFDSILFRVFRAGNSPDIMLNVCEKRQYFPLDIIKLTENESFVDIGAFDGDTIKEFIDHSKAKFDNIYAFELDTINFKSLQKNAKLMPNHDKILIFNFGIWDSECDITYSIGKTESSIGNGDGKGHLVPLDDVLKNKKVTFIKMDIEGAEPRALRGAQNIIRTQKPKLAICIYHDFKHLWEIPLYIKELVPEYKIYLRHHTDLAYETVCYAVL